jgi:oxalate decarboxylase/phosphoglucose isomerase-like protein (cupin superfamily)
VNLTDFPMARGLLHGAYEVELGPGDMLYIPPYYMHEVSAGGRRWDGRAADP